MQFSKAPANPYYDDYGYIERMESETDVWSIFLCPLTYDFQVQAGITNAFY